jgi:S1-C subfamily serine protease/thioredoxin-related protein
MQMRWPCPSCGAALRAEARHAGRRTRCPKCRQEVVVPASAVDESAVPPPVVEPVERLAVGDRRADVGVPPLGGSAPFEESKVENHSAPEEKQPWEEVADPNAPIEISFLGATPPTDETTDDEDVPFAPPPVAPLASKSPTGPAEPDAGSNRSIAERKGRRAAVPPPKRALAGEADARAPEDRASAGDADQDDLFSAIVSAPRHAGPKAETKKLAAGHHPPTNTKLIWIVCGSIAAVVLIAIGILGMSGALNGPAVVEKPRAGPSLLVLDWPKDERGGGMMTLDGVNREVSQEHDSLEVHLASGESHKLHLERFGAAPIDITIPPQPAGARYTYKPDWKAVSANSDAGKAVANDSTDHSSSSANDDKPVAEDLPALNSWPTDLESAKKEAGKAKKDILVVFFGADRRDWCYKLAKEVLLTPDFRKFADAKFAPVLFEAKGKSFEAGTPAANLADQYRITGFPTLVLADSDGLAYAYQAYMDPESSNYIKKLQEDLLFRDERDKLLAATTRGTDDERLLAAVEFIRWLGKHDLLHFYEPQISRWKDLAERVDPQNEKGQNEALFITDWVLRLDEAAKLGAADLHAVAESLEGWKKSHQFKNPNLAAVTHMRLAAMLFQAGDQQAAATYLKEALDCGPTDPHLREMLEDRVAESNHPVSSGTGFSVAEHGYIVTNNHVVEGPGSIWVRLPGDEKKEVAAKLVAADEEHDIALLQLAEPDAAKLKPLPLLADTVGRGTSVALFGYPLGDVLGEGIKFNQGVINALPDKGRDGMYLLDCTVNPGNSGGPLCDKRGLVVGLVSAKTFGGEGVGSYGMARPTNVVADFLKAQLPGFKPATGQGAAKLAEWSDVDALVSPSVVMILKREK